MIKSTAIQDIITTLNQLVKPMQGAKIKDFSRFHEKVQKLVNPYLAQMGLEYRTWYVEQISTMHPTSDIKYNHLFALEIPDFIEDKRVRYGRQGKVKSIYFTFVEFCKPEISLNEYEYRCALNDKRTKVKRANESIEAKIIDLEQARAYLAELNATPVKIV